MYATCTCGRYPAEQPWLAHLQKFLDNCTKEDLLFIGSSVKALDQLVTDAKNRAALFPNDR